MQLFRSFLTGCSNGCFLEFSPSTAEARVRFFINIFISGFAVCASGNDHHFEEDFVQTFFAKEKH
jgi:hypothetical protein